MRLLSGTSPLEELVERTDHGLLADCPHLHLAVCLVWSVLRPLLNGWVRRLRFSWANKHSDLGGSWSDWWWLFLFLTGKSVTVPCPTTLMLSDFFWIRRSSMLKFGALFVLVSFYVLSFSEFSESHDFFFYTVWKVCYSFNLSENKGCSAMAHNSVLLSCYQTLNFRDVVLEYFHIILAHLNDSHRGDFSF